MAEQIVDKLIINIDVTGNASEEISNINTQLKNMGKKGKESVDKNKLFSSLSMFTGKLVVMGYALKKTVNMFSSFVNESTSYTENLNLFRVTFGRLSDEAERFANTFANALGLDVSQVMRNMGFFNQIATGFGIVQDKAYQMSELLTQISYDIASFFDLPIDDAIAKVQSGLAGELEPLRRIGYALDQATLQQLAYNMGIRKSIREMTQAEKAQLRTIAIYQQSKNVMGDLAETIESPANQLRILRQQFTLLARSIGNMVIPILTKILPVINGVVQGLTAVFNQVAKIFGFQLGEGARETAGEFDGIASSINNVEKSAKKMLLPFDNFLSLSRDLGEGTTSGGLDLAIPTYDALAGLSLVNDKIKEISQKIGDLITPLLIQVAELSQFVVAEIGNMGIDIDSIIGGLFKITTDIITLIKPVIKVALQIISALEPVLFLLLDVASVLTTVISPLLNVGASLLSLIIKGLSYLVEWVVDIFKFIGNIIINTINLMLTPLRLLLGLFGKGKELKIALIPDTIMPALPFATGGFTPEVTGTLFQVGENGRPELMGSVRGKNAVANVQSIEGAMENAAYRGMTRALSTIGATQGSQRDIVLNIDGKELTRATVKNMANELSKNYRVNFVTR